MKKSLKLLMVMIVLCFLAVPAASFAAYDSLYANAADSIFANDSWTGMEDLTGDPSIDGATYAYHVWYDEGGVRVDYYAAWYDTYTTEWLTYDSSAGNESWLYTAALDGSYQVAEETFDYANYDLDYTLFDDGSSYQMEYDFESVDGSYTGWYDYYVDIVTEPSGYYYYDYEYDSKNLTWDYELENDVDHAQFSEYKYYYDPVNGEQWGEDNWKSTATGSYNNSSYSSKGTATSYGSGQWQWSWDYDEVTGTSESFSADYSSFWSSYWKNTYSDAGDTYWYQWEFKITDTDYYGKGYSWENDIDNYYQSFSEGLMQDNGQDYFYKSYAQNSDTEEASYDYYSSFWEYKGSGEWHQEESWNDYNSGWYVWNESYYEPQYGETYTDAYQQFDDGNKYWYKDVASYKYDSGDWENDTTVFFSDYTGLSSYYAGTGSYDSVSYGYDSDIQGQWYDKRYYTFEGRPGTSYYYYNQVNDYSYSEWHLTDSDEKYVSWSNIKRDPSSTPSRYYYRYDTLTSENYDYSLRSDTGNEDWSYSFDDYTGVNNTSFYEHHYKNVYTGIYNNLKEYTVEDVSYVSSWDGQDLDYSWSGSESDDYVADTYYETESRTNLTSGFQYWNGQYKNDDLGTWWHVELVNATGTAWVGNGTLYDGSLYDLYYYASYPDDYFLTEDQASLPAFMPDEPWSWL